MLNPNGASSGAAQVPELASLPVCALTGLAAKVLAACHMPAPM
jgi:hypothetical protein